MKLSLSTLLTTLFFSTALLASPEEMANPDTTIVWVPKMIRQASHVQYIHELLKLTLDKTKAEYGGYDIRYHDSETLPERQLKGLEEGKQVSVTFSHAKSKWDTAAIRVPFPLIKGLGSYRFFFTMPQHIPALEKLNSIKDFYQFSYGQGLGWSTAGILEDNQYRVVYGSSYAGMFVMLNANRFDLLMRSAYEILGEHPHLSKQYPNITFYPHVAMLTFLPMYFYVSDAQPELATRLEKGLKAAAESGEFDALFNRYFADAVNFSLSPSFRAFWIDNQNVTVEQFNEIKPYLLPALIEKIEPQFASDM